MAIHMIPRHDPQDGLECWGQVSWMGLLQGEVGAVICDCRHPPRQQRWHISCSMCKVVSLHGTLGTLEFKVHREYIDFPFCGILGQAMKVYGQGWQDPFDVARKQWFSHRESIDFQICHHNSCRYQAHLVQALLLSIHKCSWTVNQP